MRLLSLGRSWKYYVMEYAPNFNLIEMILILNERKRLDKKPHGYVRPASSSGQSSLVLLLTKNNFVEKISENGSSKNNSAIKYR